MHPWGRAFTVTAALLGAAVGPAAAKTVTIGPSPLDTSASSYYCDGISACTSKSWAPTVSMGGAYATAARGKIVSWRVAGSANGGGTVELWVVRANGSTTSAVGGPSVASDLGGGSNAVNPPLALEAGDSIAATVVNPGSGSTSVKGVSGAGFARYFQPGFTALDTPLSPGGDLAVQMQFNADVVLAPVVDSITPTGGSSGGGTAVTISGSNLDGATLVSFGNTGTTAFTVSSPTQITVTAPAANADSTVDVTVSGLGGTSAPVAGARFTYTAPPGDPTPTPTDTTPPVLGQLAIAPRTFVAARSGASVVAAAARGARVTYTLSEPARTTFSVKRKVAGVRIDTTCVKATRRVLAQIKGKRHRCDFLSPVAGTFSINGAQGANRFRFTGRLGHRTLAAGRYVLYAATTDAAGNKDQRRRAAFQIRRR